MKTAISIPDALFKEVEKLAKEGHHSRSEVFTLAIREYLETRKNRTLLAALNDAYAAAETPEEYRVRQKAKKRYARNSSKERS